MAGDQEIQHFELDTGKVPVDEALTMVFVRRRGQGFAGVRAEVTEDFAAAVRERCVATLQEVDERVPRQIEPDLVIDPSEEYLATPRSRMREHRNADAEAGGQQVDADLELLAILDRAADLDTLAAAQIPRSGFVLYAAVIGDTPGSRTAFLRKSNPRSAAKAGRIVGSLGERLARVEGPVFILDDSFDIVIDADGVAALSQPAFEGLFRNIELMSGRYPEYIKAITSSLPLDGDGEARLLDRAVTNSRIAKRLRSIYESGHLQSVTIADVRREARQLGLDHKALIHNGRLVLDDQDPTTLLKLLNDDLFTGGLSKSSFEAGSKSRR